VYTRLPSIDSWLVCSSGYYRAQISEGDLRPGRMAVLLCPRPPLGVEAQEDCRLVPGCGAPTLARSPRPGILGLISRDAVLSEDLSDGEDYAGVRVQKDRFVLAG
jgi:hypothetical protein